MHSKQKRFWGYLLWEMGLVIVVAGIFLSIGAIRWQAWFASERLDMATQLVVANVHEAQVLARGNAGRGSQLVSLYVLPPPKNMCYLVRGVNIISDKTILPTGVEFATSKTSVITFQQDGKIIYSQPKEYVIVLKDNRGYFSRIIISAQTGRVRVSK